MSIITGRDVPPTPWENLLSIQHTFTRSQKKELLKKAENNEYGIETLKMIETFKANLIKEVWTLCDEWINQGKKPNFFTPFRFWDDVVDLSKIIKKREEIGKEFKDLTEQEVIELDSIFRAALSLEQINNEGFDIEEFIERTNFVIGVNYEYVKYLASLKK